MQTDVIIFPNSGLAGRAWHENLRPRLDTPVDLGHGVELRKLPVDLAEQIIVACKPQGYYPRPARAPVRNWGQLYTFVRENPPLSHHSNGMPTVGSKNASPFRVSCARHQSGLSMPPH